MISVPMKSNGAVDKRSVLTINNLKVQGATSRRDILSLNKTTQSQSGSFAPGTSPSTASPSQQGFVQNPTAAPVNSFPVYQAPVTPAPINAAPPVNATPPMQVPPLMKQIQKGQKVPIEGQTKLDIIQAKLGWNTTNANCDVDVSAFLLNSTGKVIGDSWFVFYGQETSPDGSTVFSKDNSQDREIISVDFTKLNPQVAKIVFVLTINEAFEKNLNFSMLKDAYIRIMDSSNNELVSFQMTDYYANVTSMMIGEVYQHNGSWKFNAVGNGVAKDLAGLCELYGVQVV